MIYYFILAFVFSLAVGMLIVKYQHLHAHFSMDHDLVGVQKFHAIPTPRIGGIPIISGLIIGVLLYTYQAEDMSMLLLLMACLPVFIAGLAEDFTKKVSPPVRLMAAFFSAGLAIWLTDAVLLRLGVPLLDEFLFAIPFLAIILTVFSVGGVCHSNNIIDGYNGLMGGVSLIGSLAFSYVAFQLNDSLVLTLSLILVAALLGFLVWNFPRGLIFAGDAGAYLVGFLLAEMAVLLVARHPHVVSPWFPCLVLIYPIFETVFTIIRRKTRKAAAGLPDSLHFHQIVYKRLVRWMVGKKEARHLLHRNSLTAPYLWIMTLFTSVPAVIFWKYESMLQVFCFLFIITYVWLYRRIIHFRSPRWLIFNGHVAWGENYTNKNHDSQKKY